MQRNSDTQDRLHGNEGNVAGTDDSGLPQSQPPAAATPVFDISAFKVEVAKANIEFTNTNAARNTPVIREMQTAFLKLRTGLQADVREATPDSAGELRAEFVSQMRALIVLNNTLPEGARATLPNMPSVPFNFGVSLAQYTAPTSSNQPHGPLRPAIPPVSSSTRTTRHPDEGSKRQDLSQRPIPLLPKSARTRITRGRDDGNQRPSSSKGLIPLTQDNIDDEPSSGKSMLPWNQYKDLMKQDTSDGDTIDVAVPEPLAQAKGLKKPAPPSAGGRAFKKAGPATRSTHHRNAPPTAPVNPPSGRLTRNSRGRSPAPEDDYGQAGVRKGRGRNPAPEDDYEPVGLRKGRGRITAAELAKQRLQDAQEEMQERERRWHQMKEETHYSPDRLEEGGPLSLGEAPVPSRAHLNIYERAKMLGGATPQHDISDANSEQPNN
ncbi:hypothetical protein BDV95DRAFT_611836 [Massariosphaeria phaeospora]|uniref:Uncharacterized protein n=1 Tax=Massariosphaeria phaeospora TaxID=100035 RepID=A0A7C8M237_9PLEO|nr:hypothetical protein BDV95DRAFT_611836 [Massariosphaeria phaeospora]